MEIDSRKQRRGRPRTCAAHVLLTLGALLGTWAMVALISGGVRLQFGGFIVSSRNPVRPAIVAVLLAIAAWHLDGQRVEAVARRLFSWLSGTQRFVVPLASTALLITGIAFGGRAAIGPDSFGYNSQSILWAQGDLTIEQPFVALMPWPDADWTFSPLGYRPAPGHELVPIYPPGFPLLMVGARLISSCGPYYVVPFCAAALVLLTAVLGRRVFGSATATAGATMVAASPVVILWSLSPMSDVPAATFWIAALLAADFGKSTRTAAAGGLAGIAMLVRPNLAPLALFPLLLSAMHADGRRKVFAHSLIFVAAVTPFAVFIGTVSNALYGSPFASGYGDLSFLFSLSNFPVNMLRYPMWWWSAHGVVGFLFLAGILRPRPANTRRRVLVLFWFSAAVGLLYVFYVPFDDWAFLRFVIPALPILLLLSADAAAWLSSRFGPLVSHAVLTTVTALAVLHGIHRARWDGFFRNAEADQRYADAGLYINSVTPPQTVVLAMLHSGSVRFYSGRLTLRYDALDPEWLDRALDRLEELGFSTYALLEDVEEPVFRSRFETQRSVRVLDAGPLAIRSTRGGELRFFALRAPASARNKPPAQIPHTSRFDCIDPSPRFGTRVEIRGNR